MYHSVGTPLAFDTYGISIVPELFERHMAILAKGKMGQVVGLAEGLLHPATLRIAITFDDGYRDNLYVAAPILLKYRLPFTVFVTSSFVQSRAREYLLPEDLRELAALPGVTVGSHGVTHRALADCNETALDFELRESRRYLESVTGRPIRSVAYPHGSVNRRVVQAAKQIGYEIGVCSRFAINKDQSRDLLLLCRSEVLAADTERVFLQKLRGDWDWCRWRSRDLASIPKVVPLTEGGVHRQDARSSSSKPDAEHPDSMYPLW